MKKPSSKHILIGAVTPSLARKHVRRTGSFNSLYKSRSCTSLEEKTDNEKTISKNNYLTVHVSFQNFPLTTDNNCCYFVQAFPPSIQSIPTIRIASSDELIDLEDSVTTIPVPDRTNYKNSNINHQGWTTMTPHEVANWIDKKSRIAFPVAFIIFNLFYWSFVYAL